MSTTIKANVASILNNDPDGDRVTLSIAQDEDGTYFILTDSDEDCGPHASTIEGSMDDIEAMYGTQNSPWDLQYS